MLEDAPGEFNKLDEGLYKLVKHVFNLRRVNPENQEDAGKMYETMVSKATYNKLLKCRKGVVAWDIEAVKKHLELNKYKNTQVFGFAPLVIEKFGLTPAPKELFVHCLDEGIDLTPTEPPKERFVHSLDDGIDVI